LKLHDLTPTFSGAVCFFPQGEFVQPHHQVFLVEVVLREES